MYTLIRSFIILSILGVFAASPGQAGDVTGLTVFQSGDAALASEVNANFSAVKTAVDDNYSRIQAIGSGTSYLSIPARGGFFPWGGAEAIATCYPLTIAWSGTGSNKFYAPVSLPQDAVITEFTYHYWKATTATTNTTASLIRIALPSTSASETMATVTSDSSGHSSESTTSIDNPTIDNQNYQYLIEVTLPTAGSLCLDGVMITYTFGTP